MALHSLGSQHPPTQVSDTQQQYVCFHGSGYLEYLITEESAARGIESSRGKTSLLSLFDLHCEVTDV